MNDLHVLYEVTFCGKRVYIINFTKYLQMKKNILAFIAICFAIAAQAQNGGYIEYKISSSKGGVCTDKLMFSEFGSASEFNTVVPQTPGGYIFHQRFLEKSNPHIFYEIDDKSRTYIAYYNERKRGTPVTKAWKNYTVTKIGDETINGYRCVHAIINYGTVSFEVWNTKDIPDYNKYTEEVKKNGSFGIPKRKQTLKARGCDGLPVKVFYKRDEMQGEMTIELVKVEKRNFTKSDFEIPAWYVKSETHKIY